jgi:hypothetical protein
LLVATGEAGQLRFFFQGLSRLSWLREGWLGSNSTKTRGEQNFGTPG